MCPNTHPLCEPAVSRFEAGAHRTTRARVWHAKMPVHSEKLTAASRWHRVAWRTYNVLRLWRKCFGFIQLENPTNCIFISRFALRLWFVIPCDLVHLCLCSFFTFYSCFASIPSAQSAGCSFVSHFSCNDLLVCVRHSSWKMNAVNRILCGAKCVSTDDGLCYNDNNNNNRQKWCVAYSRRASFDFSMSDVAFHLFFLLCLIRILCCRLRRLAANK